MSNCYNNRCERGQTLAGLRGRQHERHNDHGICVKSDSRITRLNIKKIIAHNIAIIRITTLDIKMFISLWNMVLLPKPLPTDRMKKFKHRSCAYEAAKCYNKVSYAILNQPPVGYCLSFYVCWHENQWMSNTLDTSDIPNRLPHCLGVLNSSEKP